MFNSQMIYSKKHSHIKKQVIAQQCITLLRTNKYVLFFHYNANADSSPFPPGNAKGIGNAQAQGLRNMGCNWQQFKERIQHLHSCKSLLLPSKIAAYGPRGVSQSCAQGKGKKEKNSPEGNPLFQLGLPFLIQGGAFLVACSSLSQMATVLEKCSSPTFLCIGGTYEMRPISHLDIQRWVSLEDKENTHNSALSRVLHVLVHWQKTFPPISLNLRPFVDLERTTGLVTRKLLAQLVSLRGTG